MTLAELESAFSSNPENINAAHALIEGLRGEIESFRQHNQLLVKRYEDRMREIARKDVALRDAKFALNHSIPSGCWSLGPLTGDVIHDHVSCPGCHAISMIDSALAGEG